MIRNESRRLIQKGINYFIIHKFLNVRHFFFATHSEESMKLTCGYNLGLNLFLVLAFLAENIRNPSFVKFQGKKQAVVGLVYVFVNISHN